MRRLILLRHAKTETNAASGRDRDRALNPRGHEDAAAIGAYLAEEGYVPDLVWLSPATRVQQTWAIVAKHLPRPAAETHEALYGADCETLLDRVRGAPDKAATLLICGHNPTLHEAALALCAEGHQTGLRALAENLPTGALCVIDFKTDEWADAVLRSGRLERFMSPRLLRETSG